MTTHCGTRVWGTDRIVPRGDKLVVYSSVDMHDWQVRRYRRPAIIVDGVTYFVAKKEAGENKEVRYVLEPWPENFRDLAGRRIHYDEEYVRVRDAPAGSGVFSPVGAQAAHRADAFRGQAAD